MSLDITPNLAMFPLKELVVKSPRVPSLSTTRSPSVLKSVSFVICTDETLDGVFEVVDEVSASFV